MNITITRHTNLCGIPKKVEVVISITTVLWHVLYVRDSLKRLRMFRQRTFIERPWSATAQGYKYHLFITVGSEGTIRMNER